MYADKYMRLTYIYMYEYVLCSNMYVNMYLCRYICIYIYFQFGTPLFIICAFKKQLVSLIVVCCRGRCWLHSATAIAITTPMRTTICQLHLYIHTLPMHVLKQQSTQPAIYCINIRVCVCNVTLRKTTKPLLR